MGNIGILPPRLRKDTGLEIARRAELLVASSRIIEERVSIASIAGWLVFLMD